MSLFSALAALALLAAPGPTPSHRGPVPQPQVAVLPPFDATAGYPARAPVSDQLRNPRLVRLSAPLELEPRYGVPTFLFAAPSGDALSPRQAGATAEGAARMHLGRYAGFYGLTSQDLASARVLEVHDTGSGAVIVKFGQAEGGLPVFHQQLAVVMNRQLELVALSGFLSPLRAPSGASRLQPAEALGAALASAAHPGVEAGQLAPVPSAIPGELHFDAAPGARVAFTRPARVKRVLFPLPDQLVPAYYVELFVVNPEGTGDEAYAEVVSARDGALLYRHSLIAYDFSYRAWASDDLADGGLGAPFDGPYGNDVDPHPTGNIFTSLNPPFTTPGLHTLDHGPGVSDPWLYPDAGETVGNNADAYVDLAAPDGYSPNTGDFRAGLTGPLTFDRTYDTSKSAESSKEQQKASIAQLFYDVNFFHDWYYTVGFDEKAGNAQLSNYGRGGIENDPLLAEAQDYSGRNNSNMETPSDGYSPRMQMYVWDGASPTTLTATAPQSVAGTYTVAGASFGPQTYHLSGAVAAVSGADQDGCATFSSSDAALVHGKIALIDRGTCSFKQKAVNVQAAGAVGFVVVQNRTDPPFEMGDDSTVPTAVTIPGQMIGQADGQTLRVTSGLQVTLDRTAAIDRDGTIDNQIVAHEWGHYISNRLIDDGNGLDTNMAGGMGEGWADFHAMLLTVRPEDAPLLSNIEWGGVWPLTAYVSAGQDPQFGFYFGIRRVPYSTDLTKDPLTYVDIAEGQPLPTTAPEAFGQDGVGNSEVHNTGEVWCTMLWEAYAALLRQTPERMSFDEARERMRSYLVAAYKATPTSPTFLEARDALLAVAYANDITDFNAFQKAFAKRGAGLHAVSPDRYSNDNTGVVEDYSFGNDVAVVSASLTDDVSSCDHDGVLDNGETGTLTVVLKNIGGAPLTHTSAQVVSADGSLDISGATVPVPASDPFGPTVTVKLPVTLNGASGIAGLNLAVQVSDPDITSFGVSALPVTVEGNYDVVPNSSKVDTVESPTLAWTSTAETGNVNIPGQGETPLDGNVAWTRIAVSPTDHRLFGVDDPQPSLLHLTSPALKVGQGALTVTMKARWSFEVDSQDPTISYDGAILELSDDNGVSWTDVGAKASPGYGGKLYDQSGNPLSGKNAFVSTNPSWPDLDTVVVPLGTAYAGKTVKLRFSIGSDAAAAAYGMELDDLSFSGITNSPFDGVVADRHICESNPPVGKLTAPSVVTSGKSYTLDGSASVSTHGAPLTFTWTQLSGPQIDLSDPHAATVRFTAPDVSAATLASFQLTVSDGTSNGYPVVASFTILPAAKASAASPTSFTPPGASSGGCGAAGGGLELLALAGLVLLRRKRRA